MRPADLAPRQHITETNPLAQVGAGVEKRKRARTWAPFAPPRNRAVVRTTVLALRSVGRSVLECVQTRRLPQLRLSLSMVSLTVAIVSLRAPASIEPVTFGSFASDPAEDRASGRSRTPRDAARGSPRRRHRQEGRERWRAQSRRSWTPGATLAQGPGLHVCRRVEHRAVVERPEPDAPVDGATVRARLRPAASARPCSTDPRQWIAREHVDDAASAE